MSFKVIVKMLIIHKANHNRLISTCISDYNVFMTSHAQPSYLSDSMAIYDIVN